MFITAIFILFSGSIVVLFFWFCFSGQQYSRIWSLCVFEAHPKSFRKVLAMHAVKLVVVAANDLVRSGIHMLSQATQSIDMVYACSAINECEHYLKQQQATVLLLDDTLPDYLSPKVAIAALQQIAPSLRIIVLSDHLSEYYIQHLIKGGVAGFIYKEDRLEDTLVAGIRAVAEGHIFLSPQASGLPYDRQADGQLNRTDMEVLHLLARGYTVQEIGARVGVVDRTVYRIRTKLRRYLAVRTNEQVVEAAFRKGLLKTNQIHELD